MTCGKLDFMEREKDTNIYETQAGTRLTGGSVQQQNQRETSKMKETLNKYEFTTRFREFSEDLFNQMGGYEGLGALFDYLTDIEEEMGREFEFDPVCICCEYTVYENKEQAISAYSNTVETIEELEDNTTVIPFGNDQLIVACF